MVEVKHFNCFNELLEDETFVCRDKRKRDVWVRQLPPFAITEHPLLKPCKDNYQSFTPRLCMDGITLTGVRAAESVQRLQYMANMKLGGKGMTRRRQIFPIYDWTTNDVWLYLRNEGVEIPRIYFYLWQTGTTRNQLRVSQFFSVDTAKSLVQMNEYYPDLMERIIHRESNAYLVLLYWDTEMFRRNSSRRKEIVQRLMGEGKTVEEIGKQLGMKPEEIFRLSGFTREEFLKLMTKDAAGYSKAVIYRKV